MFCPELYSAIGILSKIQVLCRQLQSLGRASLGVYCQSRAGYQDFANETLLLHGFLLSKSLVSLDYFLCGGALCST